jgi:hypothetical protein
MSSDYRVIYLGSGFGVTQRNRYADVQINCGFVDEAIGRFIQSSLLRPVADKTQFIMRDKRKRLLRMFDELARVHRVKGPKIVFAHIPAPQAPFLFDAKGNPTEDVEFATKDVKAAYLKQLVFIDRQVERIVDAILAGSEIPPVIILQADHGPNFAFPGVYKSPNPPREALLEKMRIFNALYLPDEPHSEVEDARQRFVTPVNTFRYIFNRYFGAGFPLLEERSYFSTLASPERLVDVTERLISRSMPVKAMRNKEHER